MTILTLAEFARQQGYSRSHVTRLKQAGRLVTVGQGRDAQVNAEESVARIEATRGSRHDVADRHAETRAGGVGVPPQDQHRPAKTAPGAPNAAPDGSTPRTSIEIARESRAEAEARLKVADADKAEMERDKMAGNLLAREDVDAAFKAVGASIRALVGAQADQLAPILAPMATVEDVHRQLTESGNDLLTRFEEDMQKRAGALQGSGA